MPGQPCSCVFECHLGACQGRNKTFKNRSGYTQHKNFMHPSFSQQRYHRAEADANDINDANSDVHGGMFVPIILGSHKTTVSVGTGNTEFYPLYTLIGNVHNSTWQAHRNAVSIVAFLVMPKSECCYLYHPFIG